MEKNISTIKNILIFITAILLIYILYVLSNLLIPLFLAFFLALLLQPILAWFEKKHVPLGLSMVVISVTTVSILYLFGLLIYQTGASLVLQKDELLSQITLKLNNILNWFNGLTSLQLSSDEAINQLVEMISADWLLKSTGNFAEAVGNFSSVFFMTLLYLLILLGSILKYEQYIRYLSEGTPDTNLLSGFEKVKRSIVTYIKVKFFISLLTGFSYGIISWAFGLKFALFWGFLAFILNFIPTFGSIIATIPPLLLGLIQIDSTGTLILLLVFLFAAQTTFGNILEPKLMGTSLALNTITVLLGLVFWGYLWGVTGMVLSVPLLVLVKVILEEVSGAEILVRLM
ncbi:MAG: AI-2E family transporter, partial [Bacteroidota bacterium]